MSTWPTARVDRARGQDAGGEQHERDVQRGLVGEDAVGLLAVLAQRLAVVGGQDDQGRPSRRASSSGASRGSSAASAAATSPR